MKQKSKNKNFKFFTVLILIVFLLSVPSIYRVYQIRYLYFSKRVQDKAIKANIFLRKNYGIGATDLKLKKIYFKNKNLFFSFGYKYHSLSNFFKFNSQKILIKVDENGKIQKI